ncbi:hypothetical protein HPB49_013690 [Dermacentor silvarum]|uniref:Uncharacterized protein n=1 Tax=Dermacentor silvarum TaxID=543639 RepID=A0ACB8DZX6_DERSI|nr:hypothetical protein HPB49_013690 [Dermacentor silvarum]
MVYLLDEGHVVEQDNHEDLVAKKGFYFHLMLSQLTENEDAEVPAPPPEPCPPAYVELLSARKILQKARPDCSWFFLVSLASIVVGASLPVFAVFYSEIFNTFTLVGQDMQNAAFFWSMMFLVLAAASGLGHFFRTLGVGIAGENLTFRLRVLCWPTYCGNTWGGLMKTPIPLPNWPLG